MAILLAFASDRYLTGEAASSSVATSLNVGLPLVVTARFLQVYSYLPQAAVFLQSANESEMDAVSRLMQLSVLQLQEKLLNVKASRDMHLSRNRDIFGQACALAVRAKAAFHEEAVATRPRQQLLASQIRR